MYDDQFQILISVRVNIQNIGIMVCDVVCAAARAVF